MQGLEKNPTSTNYDLLTKKLHRHHSSVKVVGREIMGVVKDRGSNADFDKLFVFIDKKIFCVLISREMTENKKKWI